MQPTERLPALKTSLPSPLRVACLFLPALLGARLAYASSDEERCIRREEELKYDKVLRGDDECVDPPVYYVGEVVVTGRRISNMEQAGTSTVIEAGEIEAHGDKTLDRVLERIPGVTTYKHTKGHTRVRMRGFDQDKVLLLVDGVPVSDVYATDVDIASISVENISKIIVNRGVSSALYGTGGAMGTINVVSKKPARLFAEARTEYGVNGDASVNLVHGAPLGDFYYLLSGSIIHSPGFVPSLRLSEGKRREWFDRLIRYYLYPVDDPFGTGPLHTFDDVTIPAKEQYLTDTGLWDHNDYSKYFVSAKAGYSFNRHVEAGLSSNLYWFQGRTNTYDMNAYSVYRGNRWKPRYAYFGDEQEQVKKFALRNRAFVWPYVYRVDVAPYVRIKKGGFSLTLHTFYLQGGTKQDGYADTDHNYVKGDTILFKGQNIYEPFHDLKRYSNTGFRLTPSYRFADWHRLSLSLHFRHDEYKGLEQAISPTASPQIYSLMGSSAYVVEDLSAQFLSLAIEDELRLWGRLKLAVGVSYDMQHFAEFKLRQNGELDDAYIIEDDAMLFGSRDSFNPALGLVLDIVRRRLKFLAAGSIKTRFPTLGEYGKVSDDGLDQGLKPERSYNANTGLELYLLDKTMTVRGDYFVSVIDDRILKLGSDVPPTNVDRVVAQGAEMVFTASILTLSSMDIATSASYAYVRTRNQDYSDSSMANKGPYVEQTPEHHVNLDIRFELRTGLKIDIWATILANQRIYVMDHRPTEVESAYSTDYFTAMRLHDPVFLNCRITRRFLKYYELSFTVLNLLDDYAADPFNPGPGRQLLIAISGRWE